jgi:predicted aspartyl protease
MHGCVALEAAGGFGLPQSVSVADDRVVDLLDTGFTSWFAAPHTTVSQRLPPLRATSHVPCAVLRRILC